MEAHEWRIAAQIVHSCPRHRGDEALFTDKAAGEPADHQIAPAGRRLGVVGIRDPSDVSRELHDSVLETGAGAQEWLARRSGPRDCCIYGRVLSIWTA